MTKQYLIVFTDLDGTLLDLHSYSYKGAENTLNEIREQNIPLIFCSSKTRREQVVYQMELGINHPFIVENGGAIFIGRDYFSFEYKHQVTDAKYQVIEVGIPYNMIREELTRIRDENGFKFRGYGDMSVAEVAALTGLDWAATQRAMTREYSETIHFTDSREQLRRFKLVLQKAGLQCSHGGRFLTVTGMSNDKGKAVRILKGLYVKNLGFVKTVGIGDAMNDLPLLSEVDHPILLQRPEQNWQELNLPNLMKVHGSGPEAWARTVSKFLG